MLVGVETVELYKDGKHGVAKIYGDVNVQFYGSDDGEGNDINDGCYVSELRTGLYEKTFKLTSTERATIEKFAKELVADKKHYEYTFDLVKKTVSKR